MPFLRNVTALPAKLVNHTGTIIRFTTSQLPNLPDQDTDCEIVLLDGKRIIGHFRRNPRNPNITNPELRRWIKTWVKVNEPVDILVEQRGSGNQIVLRPHAPQQSPTRVQKEVRRKAIKIGRIADPRARRKAYHAWERDPSLRAAVLQKWPPRCQVRGCTSHSLVPSALSGAIVEVHHITMVASGGSDSPLNLCLLCANHHALVHRTQSTVISNDGSHVVIKVDGIDLMIDREVPDAWDLINT